MSHSPLKEPAEAPTAPNPAASNLKPPDGDGAKGTLVVDPPETEADVEADGSAKENCGPDGAGGRADGAEKESTGADFATGDGAGGGAATTTGGGVTLALAVVDIEVSEGLGLVSGLAAATADTDGCRKAVVDIGSDFMKSTLSRISAAKAT